MGTYRWHLIDDQDHVKAVEAIDCLSDADAMTKAAQVLERNPDVVAVEIWNSTRLVGRAPRIQGGAHSEGQPLTSRSA